MSNRIIARLVWAAVAVIGLTNGALAQDYPARPITLVVPYPAGGGHFLIHAAGLTTKPASHAGDA